MTLTQIGVEAIVIIVGLQLGNHNFKISHN
jgi:hypothetical protein